MSPQPRYSLHVIGAGLLVLAYALCASILERSLLGALGTLGITALIWIDARRRQTNTYLHPWSLYLLAVSGIGLITLKAPVSLIAGMVVAGAVGVMLAVPFHAAPKRPSKRHILLAVIFAISVLIASLPGGSVPVRGVLAVVPTLAIAELMHLPSLDRWHKAVPYGMLALIVIVALIFRAKLAAP